MRDFTVAVFVVNDDRVLLRWHEKLGRWLPPGGHIEQDELPDDAAIREVEEETGVRARLICPPGIAVIGTHLPRQLCRPAGIQLESITDGHEHIDLIYVAVPESQPVDLPAGVDWCAAGQWPALELTDEVDAWCRLAIETVAAEVRADEHSAPAESANSAEQATTTTRPDDHSGVHRQFLLNSDGDTE